MESEGFKAEHVNKVLDVVSIICSFPPVFMFDAVIVI